MKVYFPVPASPKNSLLLPGTPHADASEVSLSLRCSRHIPFLFLIEFLFEAVK